MTDSEHNQCERCQKLEDELKTIKDAFEMALVVKDYYREDDAPFNGEFSEAPPKVQRDMQRWVERWKKFFGETE